MENMPTDVGVQSIHPYSPRLTFSLYLEEGQSIMPLSVHGVFAKRLMF